MATYKVIQDIEAEDKLIGPLTMKQFIFACTATGFGFIAFMVATRINFYAAIPVIPFVLIPAVLAAPLGRDQPTEIWLAAQIRFLIKPRKRIWDQSGIKELVTITVPKKVQKILTKGYSQQEVKSRLRALADTIDSRGWAVKNVNLNLNDQTAYALENSERLVNFDNLPQATADSDIKAADDIMDYKNNPVAQQFDKMVQDATLIQRQYAIKKMENIRDKQQQPETNHDNQSPKAVDYSASTQQEETPNQNDTIDTEKLLEHLKQEAKEKELIKPHHKTIKTPEQLEAEKQAQNKALQAQAVSPLKNPAIIELANAKDLSVASIAHLAKRKTKPNDEIVVHLR